MKTLTILLSFLALAVTTSEAASKYAGDYFGLSYRGGRIVAGVNITVKSDGTFTGKGAYIDLHTTSVAGKVDDSGSVTITETSLGRSINYTAKFKANGKKFTAKLSTGNVFRGKKISSSFTQAGIYYAETDLGEEGVFLLDKDGSVYGVVYDFNGNPVIVEGRANSSGFSGESEDGVSFEGEFDGESISGVYSDGFGFEGTFDGGKF